MARQRRGGFRPPELKGTLGTLLRTTLQQAGVVRDAIASGAREGRSRIDEALSQRKRQDSLIELGEIVLDLIRRGEIDLGELPEVRDLVAHLDDLDAGHTEDHAEPVAPRGRFDRRGARDEDDTVASSTWVPPIKRADPAPQDTHSRAKNATNVWRPPANRPAPSDAAPVERPATPRKGGISFEDEDLADYMHPDDVPPKPDDDPSKAGS
ncbi:MAG: hypothetical protein JWO36_2107 [Myxococcales bacterium]|nr:hypothetical protein [Myxococcales bacterium]